MGALVRTAWQQARGAGPDAAVQQGRQYLTFLVAGESFAIPISAIKEIIEYRHPTDVPMMPSFMRGVINLRGRVVPVIDLSARFGRGKGETTRRSCIVIVEIHHQEHESDIGVAVDAVNAVLDIADADIEPPPSFGAKLRAEFIGGMGKLADKFVIILDIDKVLSVDELSLLGGLADEEQPDQREPEPLTDGLRAAAGNF
jgi:purine-binding chemotaxis protein CheW